MYSPMASAKTVLVAWRTQFAVSSRVVGVANLGFPGLGIRVQGSGFRPTTNGTYLWKLFLWPAVCIAA